MIIEPALLGDTEVQGLRTGNGSPAAAPSPQDIHSFIGRDRRQRPVDDALQLEVVEVHRKRKTPGLHTGEIRQLNVVEVIFADQVIDADGVPQIGVRLTKRNGAHCAQRRREQLHIRLGIKSLHLLLGQIVVQHRQPFTGKVRVQWQG
ncbi:hypothetical protein D3C84_645420 [compost metagenome]